MDVGGRRKLRAHTGHALARGSLALRGFALKYKDVLATGGGKRAGDAGADNPSADDDDVRRIHGAAIVNAEVALAFVVMECVVTALCPVRRVGPPPARNSPL